MSDSSGDSSGDETGNVKARRRHDSSGNKISGRGGSLGFDASQRFYEAKFPKADDLVMVKVIAIEDMGVYVSLLEYGGLEGLILTSELSKRRFRSINKLVRVGRQEVAAVVRVDPMKGYVDLSKRRVAPEDVSACENRFVKAKKVHLIARHVAGKFNISVEEINKQLIWPLYHNNDSAFDVLREAIDNPALLPSGVDSKLQEMFLEDCRSRLSSHPIKLRARIHVSCIGIEGVVAVRKALEEGIRVGNEPPVQGGVPKGQFSIQLVASPIFSVLLTGLSKEEATQRANVALEAIQKSITSVQGGAFKLQGELQIIGKEDEEEAAKEEEEESSSSSEGSGEEDSEEEDEGMGRVDESAFSDNPTVDTAPVSCP